MEEIFFILLVIFLLISVFAFLARNNYVVIGGPSILVFKGLSYPCDGCLYSNLSFWLNDTEIVLEGYFSKVLIDGYIKSLVNYLVRKNSFSLSESVRVISITYSLGNISSSQHVFFYNVYSDPSTAWKLFLFKGGWCFGASARAAYILTLYNTSSILVVSNHTRPLHAVLLVPLDNKVGITGRTIMFNGSPYIEYINYPEINIPYNQDIVYVLEFSPQY